MVSEEEIIYLYCEKGYSQNHINKKFNIDIRAILIKNNICPRSISEQKFSDKKNGRYYKMGICENQKGKNNSAYIHGKKVGQKENRRKYLEAVKDREWKCEVCGKTKTSNRFDLVVHHKDHNNKNETDDNLMILCQGCHVREHFKDGSLKGRPRIQLDDKNIVRQYCVFGKSLTNIAKEYNIAHQTIRHRLVENNIKIRNFSEQYKFDHKDDIKIEDDIEEDEIQFIICEYLKGRRVNDLSKELGHKNVIISKILKNNNVQIRTQTEQSTLDIKNKYSEEKIKRILLRYNRGETKLAIARIENISIRNLLTLLLRFTK